MISIHIAHTYQPRAIGAAQSPGARSDPKHLSVLAGAPACAAGYIVIYSDADGRSNSRKQQAEGPTTSTRPRGLEKGAR